MGQAQKTLTKPDPNLRRRLVDRGTMGNRSIDSDSGCRTSGNSGPEPLDQFAGLCLLQGVTIAWAALTDTPLAKGPLDGAALRMLLGSKNHQTPFVVNGNQFYQSGKKAIAIRERG